MNTYNTEFFARCPTNSVRIKYRLQINTDAVIHIEDILAAVENLPATFHEPLADTLAARFGGWQQLRADHHGVEIVTSRTAK